MTGDAILTVNAGSSSIKVALFAHGDGLRELARGQVERLGPAARLTLTPAGALRVRQDIGAADHARALGAMLDQLGPILQNRTITGVGHRIVHGGPDFAAPLVLDADAMSRLSALIDLAPLHQPFNLAGVRAAQAAFPRALQLGCFDTAFHRGHAWEHDSYALPPRYFDMGVRRYGFHGLSYEFVSGRLAELHPDLAAGRVIIAHLGNGASMCAVRNGRSIASTMGFSTLDGLAMGTRCGQIDPGVLLYLMQAKAMDADRLSTLLYHESGLQGLSGISHDMRELLGSDAPRTARAIRYYVTRIRHEIGALSADLGGLDGLVFTAGVGENSPAIRAQVCDGMGWLGLSVDAAANAAGAPEIGTGPVRVLVIPTDEERVIARAVAVVVAAVSAPVSALAAAISPDA